MDDEYIKNIRKIAYQNAYEHGGKTNEKVVASKVLGSIPELRKKVPELMETCSSIVAEINSFTINEQKSLIEEEFPELLEVKEKPKAEELSLPPLEGAEKGNVITRFPPEPNGYPHIGHAKAALINSEYVDMYGGKKILRFDDTNPENERLEYYAAIKVGLDWLGIKYDIIKHTSDDIELLQEKGLEIINSNNAYICTCKRDDISKNRREMKACKCSLGELEQNRDRWKKMFDKYKPGEAIARFRGNIQ